MALRHRLDPGAPANTTRSPGLRRLIDSAVERGRLRRGDFLAARGGAGAPLCLLDSIAVSRNHVMHGNIQLLPQGVSDTMRLCARIMNDLFAAEAAKS
jgi:hypothetical protein